jgi:hypothetical protein
VDDVRVTQTIGASSPTVTVDLTDNSALPGAVDSDGDGRPDDFDCAPTDPGAFAIPFEVFTVAFAADDNTIEWETSALSDAGTATTYDVMRGTLGQWPVGAGPGEACVASQVTGSSNSTGAPPALGVGYFYLVRARNVCGIGNYGFASDSSVRTSPACP